MNLLLDTHALLWWLADDPKLSKEAREALSEGENMVAVSAASAWEISIKRNLGKLKAPLNLEAEIVSNGFETLPITLSDGLAAGSLSRHHEDPFDRMLIAQAKARGLTVITRDPRFSRYGVGILPA